MLKRTPLYPTHQKLGARMVEFGGWEMPIQYAGIISEHLAVRSAAGLFDISHMGQIIVTGPAALDFLNATLTNDLRKCSVGRGQYTFLCNEQGGVIDDLYAYQLGAMTFLLIVNASRAGADFAWLKQRLESFASPGLVTLTNASESSGALALQGPAVSAFIDDCFTGTANAGQNVGAPSALRKNQVAAFSFNSSSLWVARTGYTGEDGFEIVASNELIEQAWNRIMDAGLPFGIKACGLGARDTLRTEVCYPLYGHELDEEKSPIEAGLAAFVSFDKGDFAGRGALIRQHTDGVQKKCVAFVVTGRSGLPRPGNTISSAGPETRVIGHVTSGTQSPSLQIGIGLAYVSPEFSTPGTAIQIDIRGRNVPATVASKPVYKRPAAKQTTSPT
jgi:aminomethyltransferase